MLWNPVLLYSGSGARALSLGPGPGDVTAPSAGTHSKSIEQQTRLPFPQFPPLIQSDGMLATSPLAAKSLCVQLWSSVLVLARPVST